VFGVVWVRHWAEVLVCPFYILVEEFPTMWASVECVVVVVMLKGLAAVLFSILCRYHA